MSRLRLIVNPAAGRRRARRHLTLIRQALERHGMDHDLTVAEGQRDARASAHEAAAQHYDRVIVAGGDGTVHKVVNGLAGSETALAILPLGTENVLAKELHVPFSLEAAIQFAAETPAIPIDLGKVSNHYFALMAGVGFDAQVIRNLHPQLKRQLSRLSFLFTGVSTLSHFNPSTVEVRVNGSYLKTNAWEIMVSNASIFAGRVKVAPDASIQDGRFDICIFSAENRAVFVGDVVQSAMLRRFAGEAVQFFKSAEVRIHSTTPLPVQLDGESMELKSLDFTIQPHALRVVGSLNHWKAN